MRSAVPACLAVLPLVLPFAACSSSASDTHNTGAPPSDTSSNGLAAFVASDAYAASPWKSETAAPRAAATTASPHGRVRVWLDPTAASATPYTVVAGAMAVKEMVDDTDQLVGHAVLLQNGTAARDVLYWCVGPAGRCANGEPEHTAANPLYGGSSTVCAGCHGGLIFTRLP